MAKITPILWTHKSNANGEHPIYLRISSQGSTRYLSLGEYLRPSHWNENQHRVRRSHRREAEINKRIEDALSAGRDEIYRLKIATEVIEADHLQEHIRRAIDPTARPEATDDFFAFAESVVEDMRRREQFHTAKRYRSIFRMFAAFAGRPLPFEALTVGLLRDWETHLVERGNKVNTRASKFRAIRAVLNRAIDRGICPQSHYPFRTFKYRRERTERTKLSLSHIQAMESLDLEEGTLIWHVRNYFLFSFYCAGIRFGDLATLERVAVSDGRLRYTMSKTGQTKDIALVPQARDIAAFYKKRPGRSRYLFPILDGYDTETAAQRMRATSAQNALVNKYLKKVAEQCALPGDLSFHVARHSFADLARTKGWSIYDISKALGHANLRVTERYLKGFDRDGLDEKMNDLFA